MATERIQRRTERLLDQVEEAADQGDWETVRSLAQQVLALDPENADAPAFQSAADKALGVAGTASAPANVAQDTPAAPSVPAAPDSFANGRY